MYFYRNMLLVVVVVNKRTLSCLNKFYNLKYQWHVKVVHGMTIGSLPVNIIYYLDMHIFTSTTGYPDTGTLAVQTPITSYTPVMNFIIKT